MGNRRLGFAFHESGHAVVGLHLQFSIHSMVLHGTIKRNIVTLDPPKRGTRCMGRVYFNSLATSEPLHLLALDAAGFIAQLRFDPQARTGCTCGKGHVPGDERDTLATLAKYFPGDPLAQARARADGIALAEQIINDRCQDVAGLAYVLASRGTMTGSEIRVFIKNAFTFPKTSHHDSI